MKKFLFEFLAGLLVLLISVNPAFSWGFFAHKQINRLAVFTLPMEMAGFYKKHLELVTERAVLPDKRRYIIQEEGARHYIDLDYYRDSLNIRLPVSWDSVQKLVSPDLLEKHGILPWHLYLMKVRLTEAFRTKNAEAIIKLSADIGHYLADAHVPLHTCSNYNGQYTNQHGIHGLWESRLPQLYFDDYDFFVGPAHYIEHPYSSFWDIILKSNAAVDSVLSFEKNLSAVFHPSRKFAYEDRGATTVKV